MERGLGTAVGVADSMLTESLQQAFQPGNDPVFASPGGSHATPAASAVCGPLRRGGSVLDSSDQALLDIRHIAQEHVRNQGSPTMWTRYG